MIYVIKNRFIIKITPDKYKNNKKYNFMCITILNLILGFFYQIVVIKNSCFHIKFNIAIDITAHYF